ncbi:MAG: rRNA pseudouridine synthase [Clostridia bacterium]|nr:rRNA pseudouridine synthase [Clostridia bacterium]
MGEQIRLDKCLAMLGLGSRSEVKQLIRGGSVRIDGETVRDPNRKLEADRVRITVNGTPYTYKAVRTVMMNKPAGILTAARDKKQRTVLDLLPPMYAAMGCMPAGRLDKDTTGMLILTSDGALAHRLITPGKNVGKTYEALVDGPFTEEIRARFAAGIHVEDADGTFDARPAEATLLRMEGTESLVRVKVTEGRYHQVKRMFSAVNLTVLRLRRTRIGGLSLDPALQPGDFRELTEAEVALLEQQETGG